MTDEGNDLLLGIDAGGTKTVAALVSRDGGSVRVERAGPGNAAVLGVDAFARRVRSLVDGLLEGRPIQQIARAVIGLAGIGRPEDRARVHAACVDLGLPAVDVLTDGELHYEAALEDAVGIVLAAGTGTVCTIRDTAGTFRQFGGWGYVLGDEGSGFTIGRDAIRHVLFEVERAAEPTPFTRAMLAHFEVDRPAALISATYAAETPQAFVARAADLVVRLARDGDAVATALLDPAAVDLVSLAERAAVHLGAGPYAIGLRGGLLFDDSPLRAAFADKAAQSGLHLDYRSPRRTPLGAAIVLAKKGLGDRPSLSFLEAVDRLAAD